MQDLHSELLPSGAAAKSRGLHNDGHGESGFDPGEVVSGALGVSADPTPSSVDHSRSVTPGLPTWDHTPFLVPRALAWSPRICD